ncbi:hypothetical protein QUA54_31555 [Microcoleus sp. MOSTC5]|uniref:hypothetical protein n=1 Tax=Microcoleus sp. MOSTC5 TaxID=3055378 RepID=UPI002FD6758E
MENYEFDFEFVRGQHHYQAGGRKEYLQAPAARAGWEAEKFWHGKKIAKAESN